MPTTSSTCSSVILIQERDRGIGEEVEPCPRMGQGTGGRHHWVTCPREPTRELVVQVGSKEVNLGPAPNLEQTLRYQWEEVPLRAVWAISRQVVQLVVGARSVNWLETQ